MFSRALDGTSALVFVDEIDGGVLDDGEVLWGAVFADAAVVVTEDDVKQPVKAVFLEQRFHRADAAKTRPAGIALIQPRDVSGHAVLAAFFIQHHMVDGTTSNTLVVDDLQGEKLEEYARELADTSEKWDVRKQGALRFETLDRVRTV